MVTEFKTLISFPVERTILGKNKQNIKVQLLARNQLNILPQVQSWENPDSTLLEPVIPLSSILRKTSEL